MRWNTWDIFFHCHQEKKRLQEEEKRRAELREREEEVKQIIINHNSNLKNTKEEILKAAMSGAMGGLNTTQTYTSKPYNPDSYVFIKCSELLLHVKLEF